MTREKAKEIEFHFHEEVKVCDQDEIHLMIDKIFDYFENKKDEPQEHKNQAVINFCDENEEILKDLG